MATSPSTFEDVRPDLSPVTKDRLVETLSAQFRATPLTTPIEMMSFWLAIALPFLYLPLLVTGVTSNGELLSILVLLGLNVVSLVIGHGHRNERPVE